MSRPRTVAGGAAVTVAVGVVASIIPLVGTLLGPVLGGLYVGVRSADDRRLVNGYLATALGSLLPAYVALTIVAYFQASAPYSSVTVTGAWLVSTTTASTPTALAVALAFGVVGTLVARFHTGRAGTHPAIRDGS